MVVLIPVHCIGQLHWFATLWATPDMDTGSPITQGDALGHTAAQSTGCSNPSISTSHVHLGPLYLLQLLIQFVLQQSFDAVVRQGCRWLCRWRFNAFSYMQMKCAMCIGLVCCCSAMRGEQGNGGGGEGGVICGWGGSPSSATRIPFRNLLHSPKAQLSLLSLHDAWSKF